MYHARADHRELLAVMGDSSFCHSGVQSLMNAVHNRARLTFVIFDNRRTAETEEGGTAQPRQPPPTADAPRVSLAALVRACGVDQLHEPDPFDTAAVRDTILHAVSEDRRQRRAAERRLPHSLLHRPESACAAELSPTWPHEHVCISEKHAAGRGISVAHLRRPLPHLLAGKPQDLGRAAERYVLSLKGIPHQPSETILDEVMRGESLRFAPSSSTATRIRSW